MNLTTAVNCKEEGHCLYEGTAVGSLYCCKCGQYISTIDEQFHTQPLLQRLVEQGLQDIQEGHYHARPKFRP